MSQPLSNSGKLFLNHFTPEIALSCPLVSHWNLLLFLSSPRLVTAGGCFTLVRQQRTDSPGPMNKRPAGVLILGDCRLSPSEWTPHGYVCTYTCDSVLMDSIHTHHYSSQEMKFPWKFLHTYDNMFSSVVFTFCAYCCFLWDTACNVLLIHFLLLKFFFIFSKIYKLLEEHAKTCLFFFLFFHPIFNMMMSNYVGNHVQWPTFLGL